MAVLTTPAQAANVTLQWDANTESDLAGYKIYYTDDTQLEMWSELISKDVTEYTVNNLEPGYTYSFYLTAYNGFGESDPSNTVLYSVPIFTPVENPKPALIVITGPVNIQIK
jgi:hypothetical protein